MQEEHLISLISAVLHIPANQVTLDADLIDDLGADSLSLAQLAARVEEDLGRRLPAERLQYLLTVRDLMKARERCLRNQDPRAAYLATGFLLALGVYVTTALTLHVAYARYFWMLMALCAVASGIEPQPARRVERS